METAEKEANHSHAWRGSWDRPMHIDEDVHHPFTIARMTDHNVRGCDGTRLENHQDQIDKDRMESEGGRAAESVFVTVFKNS